MFGDARTIQCRFLMLSISHRIAQELSVKPQQVDATIALLDDKATVPFIARYRKEVTGGLDDIQLRELEARLSYLRELEDRRVAVLKAIDEQGKLTDELRTAIEAAETKQTLEDADHLLADVRTAGVHRVVVVGAGLAGLTAARALRAAGVPVAAGRVVSRREAAKVLMLSNDGLGGTYAVNATMRARMGLLSEGRSETPMNSKRERSCSS
mgnify:CR=1 FL=1